MKNLLNTLCFFVLSIFIYIPDALAAANPNNVDPEATDEGGVGTMRVSMSSQCDDLLESKMWDEGVNYKDDGTKFFVSIGTDSVGVDTNNDFFPSALFDAAIVANLQAKGELVDYIGKEMVSEIANSEIQAASTGEQLGSISTANNTSANQSKNYDDLSIYEKTKVFINQQLDKAIDPETKNKLNDKNVSDKEKEDIRRDILNQKNFQDSIMSSSQGTVRGMKTVATYVNGKPGDKKIRMCMVNLWSEKLQRQADAIATGNLDLVRNQKPGKPLRVQIGNLKDAKVATKAYSKFGVFSVRNERGEVSLLSYAHAGCMSGCSDMSEKMALREAIIRADRAIIQYREENIEVQSNFDKMSEQNEMASTGNTDYYAKQNIEARYKASASGTLKGARTISKAMWQHPINKQYTQIVVRSWTPSDQDFANKIKSSLESSPETNTFQNNYESDDYEDGGAMGIDDEDF